MTRSPMCTTLPAARGMGGFLQGFGKGLVDGTDRIQTPELKT